MLGIVFSFMSTTVLRCTPCMYIHCTPYSVRTYTSCSAWREVGDIESTWHVLRCRDTVLCTYYCVHCMLNVWVYCTLYAVLCTRILMYSVQLFCIYKLPWFGDTVVRIRWWINLIMINKCKEGRLNQNV